MKRGFFSFWWCMAFALLSVVCLSTSIAEENVTWIWINSMVAGLWLFYAWREKQIDALEAQTEDDDGDNRDNWNPPNGSSKR